MNVLRNDISINIDTDLGIQITQCGMITATGEHISVPHIYDRYALTFVIRGSGTYTIDGVTNHVKAGEAFLTAPGSTTNWSTDAKDPWQYVFFVIQGAEHKQLLRQLGLGLQSRIFRFSNAPDDRNMLSDPVVQHILALYEKFQCDNTMGYGHLGCFYQIADRIHCLHHGEHGKAGVSPNEHFVKAKTYIEDNYASNISIQDIADFVGIDRSYLYRLFTQKAGMSPQMFLTDFRMNKATAMLKTGVYSNTDVAIAAGFYDYSHFAHTFQRKFGISPAQFQGESKRNKPS